MAELPRSSKYRATPGAPLPEDERARLIERLNAAYERGEVSADDYRPYLDAVFAASTLGEVAEVVEALPPVTTHEVPAIVPVGQGAPGELAPARPVGRRLTAAAGIAAAVLITTIVILLVALL
ncbi:MAG: DUF1707 domain-containing protein [Propioniciclava sp.]|uniref:DUF1707 domain-containing protein n=1 Tax=Propioniciclava sp. TaxID=2038686 RepID=UPI0039E35C41